MYEYIIRHATLYALADEEVQRIAATAYSDDGVSLYDSIHFTSRDENTIARMEQDAVDALVQRLVDVHASTVGSTITVDVPDFPASLQSYADTEITRYLSLSIVAAWLRERYTPKVEEYEARAKTAMDAAVSFLKTIPAPSRP